MNRVGVSASAVFDFISALSLMRDGHSEEYRGLRVQMLITRMHDCNCNLRPSFLIGKSLRNSL